MNLDLFNNLINSAKENKGIQNFVKELGEFLEKNASERNKISLLQKIQNEKNVTTEYRDKMNLERANILDNYAKKTADKGTMYYVFSKSSRENNTYNLCICEKGKSNNVIKVTEDELPKGAGIDSVLREKNGKYILDEIVTEEVQQEIIEMIDKLLEEQDRELSKQRVEGNLYEFVEKSGDKVWLIDKTNYTGDCFEELDFKTKDWDKASQGVIFQYTNGEYKFYK